MGFKRGEGVCQSDLSGMVVPGSPNRKSPAIIGLQPIAWGMANKAFSAVFLTVLLLADKTRVHRMRNCILEVVHRGGFNSHEWETEPVSAGHTFEPLLTKMEGNRTRKSGLQKACL